MSMWMWIAVAAMIVVAAVIMLAALAIGRRNRTERLKGRFGPEYERMMSSADSKTMGERELIARERQHDKLDIMALQPAARRKFADQWRGVQTAFVDDPTHALADADGLVKAVMRERGYPVDDFDRRIDDISVEYPDIADDYRGAHAVHVSDSDDEVGTEARRKAFVHYRALFDVLLAHDDGSSRTSHEPTTTTLQGDRP